MLFGSSTQIVGEELAELPPGMGIRIEDGYEVLARMHYLNATTAPLTVAPSYQWYTIDEATLTEELAPFIWEYKNPPDFSAGATVTVTGDCQFPRDNHPMHLVSVLPHMHKLGASGCGRQRATGGPLDGQAFLKSPGYSPDKGVLTQYESAIDLSTVAGVTFDCTWHNTLDQSVVEGGRRHQRDVHDVRLRLPAVGGLLGAGGAGHLPQSTPTPLRGASASIQRTMRRRSSHGGSGAPTAA